MLELPIDFLKECFVYDGATGRLFWKRRPRHHFSSDNAWLASNSQFAGTIAGSPNKKRRWSTKINGKLYQNHRIVWAILTGAWPDDQIDHMNGDPEDNRIENLRVVSNTDNQKNRWISSRNTSGVNGVYWRERDQVWSAAIREGGKQKHLGHFRTRDEATAARRAAEERLGYTARHGEAKSA